MGTKEELQAVRSVTFDGVAAGSDAGVSTHKIIRLSPQNISPLVEGTLSGTFSNILLVTWGGYSCFPISYWSRVENILVL